MISFSTISLITIWLSPDKRGYYLTVQTAINTMCVFLASRVTIPLMQMLKRGWKGVFSLMALLGAIALTLWLLSLRKLIADETAQATASVKITKEKGLWVIKQKNLLLLCLFLALVSCAHIAVTTYLAAYLEISRGLPVAKAATYLGYISLAGMFGGSMASLLSTKLGKRKPVLLLGVTGAMLSFLLIVNVTSEIALTIVVLLYVFFGIAYLATLFTPLIMTTALKFMSMQAAMYLFIGIYFLTCVSALFMKETGPKAKLKKI